MDGRHSPLPVLPRRASLSARRRLAGWLVALAGLPSLTVLLAYGRARAGLSSTLLLYLLLVVVVASVGGIWPALLAAFGGSLLANWYFTPPFYTLSIEHPQNVLA